ncbi:MAG: hypothetical protein LBU32_32955 [Clostridiales bacterium]|jgi:formate C-acetyltransferase|nr:hypothetical protein [Clostridiales bacterium]
MNLACNEIEEKCRSDELRSMSPRIQAHCDAIKKWMHQKQKMFGGSMTVLTADTASLSASQRRSMAFEKIMLEIPIAVEPFDIITGICLDGGAVVRSALPSFLKFEELGECTYSTSHKCPDYAGLLKYGISGILERLSAKADALSADDCRWDFVKAVRRECGAVVAFARRFASLAESLAENSEAQEKENYGEIARICRKVPEHPAESFREALQSIWLVCLAMHQTMTCLPIGLIDRITAPYFKKDFEEGGITLEKAQEMVDSFCLHVNDRAQLDPENFAVKQGELENAPTQFGINYTIGFVPRAGTDDADAINHWGLNILLAGKTADGTDAASPVTYLFLNSHEKLSMTSPVLTVRMHGESPLPLRRRVAELILNGGGMPYINNDDVIIPAYEKLGVSHEDACGYANSNCWETLIQGKSNQEMIRGVNFLYLLELALNRGESFIYADACRNQPAPDPKNPTSLSSWASPSNPVVNGIDTGSDFKEFADLMKAWKLQLDHMLITSMDYIDKIVMRDGTHGRYSSNPLLSALELDCIEKMTDVFHRGSRYDLWHVMAEAVSNAADAAAAIRKFVFEEKLVSLEDLTGILKNNWKGKENLRQQFLKKAPKFGNGDSACDSIAKEMTDYFVERVRHHAQHRSKIIFSPCIGTFSWVINIGKRIGASADGRFSQEPIAANMSPAPGRDVSGPTAAIASYLQIDASPMAAGAPIDLRINRSGLEGEEGVTRILAIIEAFLAQGGNMLTLTITNAEELKKAIAEPAKHQGLRVRMGGWSAYFVLLSEQSQKMHLQRIEHGLA